MLQYISKPNKTDGLKGILSIPGDKSISHRSVIFASLAEGESTIQGLLEGEDVKATISAFKAMGVDVERKIINSEIYYNIQGKGLKGLTQPTQSLNMGNSGTAMRLMSGILSGQNFNSHLIGDRSLSKRPMARVIEPLTSMGAKIISQGNQQIQAPPLEISAIENTQNLNGGRFELKIASAQVKSAILLAGLYSTEEIEIIEPDITRDHTERMLKGLGCDIEFEKQYVKFNGAQSIEDKQFKGSSFVVPSDFSSAMFFMVAALITPNSQITLQNIGINESRIGGLHILRKLGGNIDLQNLREVAGEPVADIVVSSSNLVGCEIDESLVALAIDEFPVISIAAAVAKGQTIITGAAELRVKESDRIKAMVTGLNQIGVQAKELYDGMIINGADLNNGGKIVGGRVDSFEDHRIAMSFAIAGAVAEHGVVINDCENVATSFPNFVKLTEQIGLRIDAKKV